MKKSKISSEYIAVKAITKSDYERCNLAVLRLTPDWLEIIGKRIDSVELVSKDSSFYSVVYWEAPDGYFVLPEVEHDEIFETGYSWQYIILEKGELDALEAPENPLDTHMMFLNSNGEIYFMCYCKHSGEEYSTECIDMKAILNHIYD